MTGRPLTNGLAKLLKGQHSSMVLNELYQEDGSIVYREACKLGREGIVSKPHWRTVSTRSVSALSEGQKSAGADGQARGAGGLALVWPPPSWGWGIDGGDALN